MFKSVCHWHGHKHASVLAIGQLRRQSVTAPSYAKHTADLSQFINVMNSDFIHTLLNACRGHSFLFPGMQKILKSIKIFQSYDHKCVATFLPCELCFRFRFHHRALKHGGINRYSRITIVVIYSAISSTSRVAINSHRLHETFIVVVEARYRYTQ